MRENRKAEVYSAAIEHLTAQAVDRAKPREPGAYAAKVRADLDKRLRPAARTIFAAHDDLTGEELAIMLEATERPEPAPISNRDTATTAALPTYEAPAWEPVPAERRAAARERIAAIKQQLATKEQP